MGCASSSATPESAASAEIDKKLREERKSVLRVNKVLLLGTGASGKTTVCKQMRLLYLRGYSEKEAAGFAVHVQFNVLRNASLLCQAAAARGLAWRGELGPHAARLAALELGVGVELDKETVSILAAIWQDAPAKEVMAHKNETEIDDSFEYFMGRIDEMASRSYVPSVEDILHCRVKTLGIVEMRFKYRDGEILMVDVGGQRTERRKWIHAFADVTLLLFVVSLSDYDSCCEEDKTKNRLLESLDLFEDVANNPFLKRVSLVIFFNKNDLFEKKLATHPFRQFHSEYQGGNTLDEVRDFIRAQFDLRNKSKPSERSVYVHRTCATDTKQIEVVWESVADVLLSNNLEKVGFSMA